MARDLLPIGSVVQLENSTALVMVAGYLPVAPSRPNYVWDYSGFRFPIGFTDDDTVYCFDHNQVQVVYAYGYKDIEEEIFMGKLMSAQQRITDMVKSGEGGPAGAGKAEQPAEPEKFNEED